MAKKMIMMVLLFSVPLLFAHGIKITVEKKSPFVIINASYHGSKALSNAYVTVIFESEKKEFQMGKMDKNGNFCFFPDRAGKWNVTVDDLMGHQKKKEIQIDNVFLTPLPKENGIKPATEEEDKKEFKKKPSFNSNEMCCYLLKIILGVVIILIITFILYRWKKRHEA